MGFQMVILNGKERGKALKFPPGEFVIGRSAKCHFRADCGTISRRHCLLRVKEDMILLRDLGSTNGTHVNGQQIVSEARLRHGDSIRLGRIVLQVVISTSDQ